MNNSLSIDTRKTIETGKQIVDKVVEFERILNRISEINGDLNRYWEGEDQHKYAVASQSKADEMKEDAKKLHNSGIFLQEVGAKYEQVRSENASRINDRIGL